MVGLPWRFETVIPSLPMMLQQSYRDLGVYTLAGRRDPIVDEQIVVEARRRRG